MRMNRPSSLASGFLLAAVIGAGAVLIAACGGPQASSTGGQPASPSTSATASRPASPVTPAASASVPPAGGASLPRGWRRCVNAAAGYSIGYPGGWYTTQIRPAEACTQFHPSRFTIHPDSEYPLTALNARRLEGKPARTDPAFARTLVWQEITLSGRRAVRFETSSTGEGLAEAGTREYGYMVRLDGGWISVHTTAVPAESRYSAWKSVVDNAVHTLRGQ